MMPTSQPDSSQVAPAPQTAAEGEGARAAGRCHLLLLILALAAGLRLYGLADESLWLDEGHTINRITNSYSGMLRDYHAKEQPPAYYCLNKAWCDEFGLSERSLRFPSVILGVLGVLMIYHVGRAMFSPRAGLLAALFLAVNPFALHYSQEARPYSFFLLFFLASIYFMVRLMRQFRLVDAIGYVLSTLAVLYCHAYGPFILPLQAIGFAVYCCFKGFHGARRQWDLLLLTLIVLFLLFLPQLMQSAESFLNKTSGKGSAQWIPVPPFSFIPYTLKLYFAWRPLALAILSIAGVGALVGIFGDREARPHLLFLLAAPVCFLLLPWIISRTLTPITDSKYTCPSMPAVVLALAWALSAMPAVLRRALVVALLLLTVLPLFYYYTKVDKDPFRQTAEILHAQVEEGDVVILNPPYVWRAFHYYFTPPRGVRLEGRLRGRRLDRALLGAKRVWEVQSYGRRGNGLSTALDTRAPAEAVTEVNDQLEVNPLANFVVRITIVRRRVGPQGPRDRPYP